MLVLVDVCCNCGIALADNPELDDMCFGCRADDGGATFDPFDGNC